ncbi:type II toxin-antitoxin system HicA family toxin [Devosia sp.]|uniref:type II toxin-antitoxin system HicA family toxin n=1 Tax=Devosia sp. TaxID=1871048 RepID=UPI0035269DA2
MTLGFERVRQKGSHVFYRHPDGRTTTVPDHSGRDLAQTPYLSLRGSRRLSYPFYSNQMGY